MTFDVMIDLRQEDRPVVRGLETMAPTIATYASFVPLETACLALTIADLDRLKNILAICNMHISPHQP